MNAIVLYKSKYGSTKTYAVWIAEALGCSAVEAKGIKAADLESYDTLVYGGGLYAEMIAGVGLITKNFERLKEKRIFVYTTGITPLDCREYYDKMVLEKNFKPQMLETIKVYNFLGRMISEELTVAHRAAIQTLKRIMGAKEKPTKMETLLLQLCDANGDFTDRSAIATMIKDIQGENA